MSKIDNPEKNVSAAFPFASKFIQVNGTVLHYIEEGSGNPILFLHGIPANLYLWRNVIPQVSKMGRAISLDLAGFGKSEVPQQGGYKAYNQYRYLEDFITQMDLKNITLVVTDLGSLLGMKYAANNPGNVKGIVAAEALILPAADYYRQLSAMQKMMYAMFRNKALAKSIIVNGTKIQSNIVPMMTMRKLSATEKEAYAAPYVQDIEKRKLVFEGPGPVGFPKKKFLTPETATNESVMMMNTSAAKLKGTCIPMLLLYSIPGVVMSKKGRELVRQFYPNLTIECVGTGKHFMAEEHPKKMGKLINEWLITITR